jgi:hypothetical protein
MKIKSALLGAALAGSMLAAGAAQAGIVYAGPTGDLPTDSSYTVTFSQGGAGNSSLSFSLDGYNTLDGQNYYEDDFSLSLNGVTIFTGTFNLGGGSSTTQAVVFTNPYGATYTNPTGNGTGVGGNGGVEDIIFASVPLIAGTNTLVFTYASLPGPANAGFQGLGDEGWGVHNVSVSAVPEVSTWAMMLAGFAGLGFLGYRRNKAAILKA